MKNNNIFWYALTIIKPYFIWNGENILSSYNQNSEVEARRKILMLLQDNIRNVISVAGLLPAFVESIDDADELEILHTKFLGLTSESHSLSKAFTTEIISIGPLLTGREELLRLLTSINGFISNLEDVCDIVTNSKDIKKIKPNYTDELLEISNQLILSITKIRE